MKHDCKQTEPLLSGYLEGELTQSERQRVDLILEDCEACAGTLEEMKELRQQEGSMNCESMTTEGKRKLRRGAEEGAGASLGQWLFLGGVLLVYGTGAYLLCVELVTDAKFAETGNEEDKFPMLMRIGVPALLLGLGILFFTVLFQRIRAAKADKYTDVKI